MLEEQSQSGRDRYRPTRVFSAMEDPESHKTSIRLVAVEYQREIPPVFVDADGNTVNVYGIWEQDQERYPCPRESTNDNVLVMTNRGIFLFCYDCQHFYGEGGRWGFKTSWAAFEQVKSERTVADVGVGNG